MKSDSIGNSRNSLIELHKRNRSVIKSRLEDFKTVYRGSEERIFAELCFCICTPQSSAVVCWERILDLTKDRILYEGNEKGIAARLRGVRFRENKARFIVEARRFFSINGTINVSAKLREMVNQGKKRQTSLSYLDQNRTVEKVDLKEVSRLRETLAQEVKGLGMKEASHFLRNIGIGGELAILDRHILRNLVLYGVIDEIPRSLPKKVYLEIELRMRLFSDEIGIPMDELDLVLWAKETGIVFK
jgi:N-glycosylase/DNA lyase